MECVSAWGGGGEDEGCVRERECGVCEESEYECVCMCVCASVCVCVRCHQWIIDIILGFSCDVIADHTNNSKKQTKWNNCLSILTVEPH